MKTKKGSCICNAVQFVVELGENVETLNCHCIDCRKATGGSFISVIEFKLESLKIDKTKLDIFTHQGGSGKDLSRYYCKNCKAPVYMYVEKYDENYIYAGLFNEIDDLKLSSNMHFTDSHFPFLNIQKTMKKKLSSKIASCLCGGIKIRAKGKLRYVNNCHCSQCMKTHGNYASYTACSENNITFVNKKTLKWYKSSNFAKRGFCSKCGASMFYKKNNSNSISISAGMFKNPTKLKTYTNIFTKGKLDYYKLDPTLRKFTRYSH